MNVHALIQKLFQKAVCIFFVASASISLQALEPCPAMNDIEVFCGIQRPEDMVSIPGTLFLLISEYGGFQHEAGSLGLFDIEAGTYRQLYPEKDETSGTTPAPWGSADCVAPPRRFSPHGIDLARRKSGELQLLVVNHGAGDSIQFFEVLAIENNIALQWRGCVTMEAGITLNDVASVPDGGFVTTALKIGKEIEKGETAKVQGRVLRWRQDSGLATAVDLQDRYGNGLNVSKDGQYLFVNDNPGGRVLKIELGTGVTISEAEIKSPDNSSWNDDGRLLVTSILLSSFDDAVRCDRNIHTHCDIAFAVTSLNPETMDTEKLYEHDGEAPFGGATITLEIGDYFYFGSFAGNRLARVKMTDR